MEYHPPSLIRRGKNFYVQITIPDGLRLDFKNQKQIQKSTLTSDKKIAEQRQHSIAAQVYAKFDEALSKPTLELAKKLQILAGVPEKFEDSDWLSVEKEDHAGRLLQIASSRLSSFKDLSQNPLKVNIKVKPLFPKGVPRTTLTEIQKKHKKFIAERLQKRRALNSMEKSIEKNESSISITPDPTQISQLEKTLDEFTATYLPQKVFGYKISQLMEIYFNQRDFNRLKTEGDKRKSISRLITFSGDLYIKEVDKVLANQFFMHVGKTRANATLKKDRSSLKLLFEFAEEMGWIDLNPFANINLRNKGKASIETVTFTLGQMKSLFKLEMPEKHRLCLSLLAATGARLDEIALLKWSDIQTDSETGIVYLDLTDPSTPRKNKRSKRRVPLPSLNLLSSKSEDRMFDYRIDADGKAQNAASRALMKFVRQVRVSDERLVVHSLRHTFKDMLRAVETPEDIADAIMGHTPSHEGGKYGAGHSLSTMLKYMNQVDLNFLSNK